MIRIKKGNVLDVETGIIVHGCNCQGVMGSGVALQVKERFPEAYEAYKQHLDGAGNRNPGFMSHVEVAPHKYIVNALTQFDYGDMRDENRWACHVSYDAIKECFEGIRKLAQNINESDWGQVPICFPMIGEGLSGGRWNIIANIINETIPDDFNKILYVQSEDEMHRALQGGTYIYKV